MKTMIAPVHFLFFSAFFSACGPVLYSNVGQNVPMFIEKGEFAGNIGTASSAGDDLTNAGGIGINAAYSISDKWAGLISFYSMKETGDARDQD